MNPREKRLAAIVGALAAALALWYAWGQYDEMITIRRNRITALERDVLLREQKVRAGQTAARRIKDYQARSLPRNPELARSLYQSWLLDQVRRAPLAEASVNALAVRGRPQLYQPVAFSVSGRAELAQLIRLLYEFYLADHLHQIRSLKVEPIRGSRQLEIRLAVEALSMPGAAEGTALSQRPSQRLGERTVDDYLAAILGRNLFAPPNQPPKIDRIADQKVEVGRELSLSIAAADPDPLDKLTYRLAGEPPAEAQLDSGGKFRFKSSQKGTYQVTVSVADDGSPAQSTDATFQIAVVDPPPPTPMVVRPDPPPPPVTDSEDARFVFVTAIVEVGPRRQLWLTLRKTGEVLRLYEGEPFTSGTIKGVVETIGPDSVEISSGKQRLRALLGQSLSEGDLLPAAL